MAQKTDITIVGAGVVGLTLACLLAQDNFSITIVDTRPFSGFPLPDACPIRVNAVNPAARALFERIGVWGNIQEMGMFTRMCVWDSQSPAHIAFDAEEIGQSALGYVLAYDTVRALLYQRLSIYSQVHFEVPDKIRNIKVTDFVTAHLESGKVYNTGLLVGADGRHSHIKHLSGISSTEPTCKGCALVATVETQNPHKHCALQRFLPDGPIALLPLADSHSSSLVWSTTEKKATAYAAMHTPAFGKLLRKALENSLGEMHVATPPVCIPIYSNHVHHYVKPHVALVGDAAHSILPLAGQGLNLGLKDAACLHRVLREAFAKRREIGAFETLRRYERARKWDNTRMQRAMEGFYHGFHLKSEWARHARTIGFGLAKLPLLKHYLMACAMGISKSGVSHFE